MSTINLYNLDPAELLPTPEITGVCSPVDEEEAHVYAIVQQALDNPNGTMYEKPSDFTDTLRAKYIPGWVKNNHR